jgi:hypothetical protein
MLINIFEYTYLLFEIPTSGFANLRRMSFVSVAMFVTEQAFKSNYVKYMTILAVYLIGFWLSQEAKPIINLFWPNDDTYLRNFTITNKITVCADIK